MTVYLLHFTREDGACRHYLGHTFRDVKTRFAEHRKGKGSKFTSSLVAQGFIPEIAHIWPDHTLDFEFRLKQLTRQDRSWQMKNWCPVCHPGTYIPTLQHLEGWAPGMPSSRWHKYNPNRKRPRKPTAMGS